MKTKLLLFSLCLILNSLNAQKKALTFMDAELQGIPYVRLDSMYKSAVHSDTSQAVFKSEAEQQMLQKAYVGFIQQLGGFLKSKDFKWEKPTRCFNRIYMNPDGTVEHFLYNFSKDQISEEKRRVFEGLVNEFLKTHSFPIKAKEKFAQCSPIKYND